MPALSSSPTAVLVDDSDPELGELAAVPAAPPGLWECLQKVTDPRKRRGVRHPITGVLAMALAATLAGAQSFLGIAEWAADAGPGELAALGLRGVVPCESTIRRCLQRLDPGSLDALIGGWMWLQTSMLEGRRVIACDGKSLRGARDAAGHLTHLLSALCQHTGTVLGQLSVGAKTNEIPLLAKLLDTMDITGAVITADALHTQRGTAEYIASRGAHYILTVKNNQRTLRAQLKALPWKQVPVLATDRERGHGRTATRSLKATEIAVGIGFPHAVQVLQLTRKTAAAPAPGWLGRSRRSHSPCPWYLPRRRRGDPSGGTHRSPAGLDRGEPRQHEHSDESGLALVVSRAPGSRCTPRHSRRPSTASASPPSPAEPPRSASTSWRCPTPSSPMSSVTTRSPPPSWRFRPEAPGAGTPPETTYGHHRAGLRGEPTTV